VDHEEHAHGPGSREALTAIARNDAMIGRLVAAARAAKPDLTIVIVSDHGFAPVTTDVNLIAPFIAAGLITLDTSGKVTDWQAEPWIMGGSAGVVLRHADDAELAAKVATLLATLKADPDMGIDEIVGREAITSMGGSPLASFLITFRPGFEPGHNPRAAKRTPSSYKGMHGYPPSDPAMYSSLFVEGPALVRHGNLGQIDMRAIAPSIAHILGVRLPGAERQPVF
jgi:predicted AlkP superfamily pyrophosphatase or phosphodiesterase